MDCLLGTIEYTMAGGRQRIKFIYSIKNFWNAAAFEKLSGWHKTDRNIYFVIIYFRNFIPRPTLKIYDTP